MEKEVKITEDNNKKEESKEEPNREEIDRLKVRVYNFSERISIMRKEENNINQEINKCRARIMDLELGGE